jgi:hypothetical protein
MLAPTDRSRIARQRVIGRATVERAHIGAVDQCQDLATHSYANRFCKMSSATHTVLRHLRLTGDCRATFVAANRRNRRLGQTTDLVYILYSHNSPPLRQGPMNWYRGYIKSSTCGSAWSWGSLCPPVRPGYGSNPDHWRTTDRTAKVPLRREHGAPGLCIGAPGRPTFPSPVSQAALKTSGERPNS